MPIFSCPWFENGSLLTSMVDYFVRLFQLERILAFLIAFSTSEFILYIICNQLSVSLYNLSRFLMNFI